MKNIYKNELFDAEICLGDINTEVLSQTFEAFNNDGRLTKRLIEKKLTVSAMESCTSGLFVSSITDYEGASAAFRGSFVTYSNEAKISAGVPQTIIEEFGVYSPETAYSMASTAKSRTGSDVAVGITGSYSNPDTENEDSITGEIYIGVISQNESAVIKITLFCLEKTRKELKQLTVDIASAVVFAMIN